MKQIYKKILIGLTTLSITACAFVELSPDAKNVSVLPNSNSAYFNLCKFLGDTTVKLWDKADNFQSIDTVENQLNTLARNEAAKMGGDTVTPTSKINGNQRTYKVYNCATKSVTAHAIN